MTAENCAGRGQASTELLVILAIMLIVFAGVIALTSQGTADIGRVRSQRDARASVDDLARAADLVYFQGKGARRQVFVKLPSDYDPGASYIQNDTILIRVGGTDYAATSKAPMQGQLPTAPGGSMVWVVSNGTYVIISNSSVNVTFSPGPRSFGSILL